MDTEEIRVKKHRKKMIAPVIITGIVVLYYVFFLGMLLRFVENTFLKLVLGIVPALLGAVMIGVCAERIKEIKGGEEDDLGEY